MFFLPYTYYKRSSCVIIDVMDTDATYTYLTDLYTGEDQFFYHSDHLGSASWITDARGEVVQHLQYCPFGEPFLDEHSSTSTYSERFTFTGKERDEETGYSYFGARYLDAALLTSWFSVDPMSDKYPSFSPYNYCAWNPVKLVDPDGRKIRFAPGTTRAQQEQFYAAVRHLDAHNCGGRYGQLLSSDITYTIIIDPEATNGLFSPSTQTITWNPLLGFETNDGDVLSPATVLNHEMTHATRYDNVRHKMISLYNKLLPEVGKEKAVKERDKIHDAYIKGITCVNGESKEETEIINGVETRTAKLLGEISDDKQATRTSHKGGGKLVVVESPTSTNKIKTASE